MSSPGFEEGGGTRRLPCPQAGLGPLRDCQVSSGGSSKSYVVEKGYVV